MVEYKIQKLAKTEEPADRESRYKIRAVATFNLKSYPRDYEWAEGKDSHGNEVWLMPNNNINYPKGMVYNAITIKRDTVGVTGHPLWTVSISMNTMSDGSGQKIVGIDSLTETHAKELAKALMKHAAWE